MLNSGKNDRAYWNLHNFGCSCCNTKQERRRARHSARQKEKRNWKKREGVR